MMDLKLANDLISSKSIDINAHPENIWWILTDPIYISQYLFGAQTITDWKPGSPILFKINFENQEFVDKGFVVENTEYKTLKYRYWSGFSGLENKPENYSMVSYEIEKIDNDTSKLTWTQTGFADENSRLSSENSLVTIMDQIKSLAEDFNSNI